MPGKSIGYNPRRGNGSSLLPLQRRRSRLGWPKCGEAVTRCHLDSVMPLPSPGGHWVTLFRMIIAFILLKTGEGSKPGMWINEAN